MAVHIRLARHGTKKAPFYRVVVTDKRSPRDGRFIERIGTFDPHLEVSAFHLDHDRYEYWRSHGAQPSPLVDRLVKKFPRAAGAAS